MSARPFELTRAQEATEPPEDSVPGLLALIDGGQPSGRYRVADLQAAVR